MFFFLKGSKNGLGKFVGGQKCCKKKCIKKGAKQDQKMAQKKGVLPWFNNGSKLGKNVFWAFVQKNQQNSTKQARKLQDAQAEKLKSSHAIELTRCHDDKTTR